MNGEDQICLSDESFEEYLNGGSSLSRAYGAIASPKVPAKVESLVLRRARMLASLRALLQTETWVGWSMPVALAACTIVMVAVLIQGVLPLMRAQAQLVMVQLPQRASPSTNPSPSVPVQAQSATEERVARVRRERGEPVASLRPTRGTPTAKSGSSPSEESSSEESSESDVPPVSEPPGPVSDRGN